MDTQVQAVDLNFITVFNEVRVQQLNADSYAIHSIIVNLKGISDTRRLVKTGHDCLLLLLHGIDNANGKII